MLAQAPVAARCLSIYDSEMGEVVTTVQLQQRGGDAYYCRTADAIYLNLYLSRQSPARITIVLPGNHVYRMDYTQIIAQHNQTSSDLTVACLEVELDEGDG